MKVSIVIPVYNEERYIATCLEHVTNQIEPADEIIVVNNNSKDDTIEIVKKFPVTLLYEPVQGMTPARNKGFNAAQGDILVKTDADTQVPRDWIKRIKSDFKNKHIVALSGPTPFYDSLFKGPFYSRQVEHVLHFFFHQHFLFGPNYALRKTTWDEIKGKVCLDDHKVHEDFDIAMHIPNPEQIYYDDALMVPMSARRMKSRPFSFFIEYVVRTIKMMKSHNKQLF